MIDNLADFPYNNIKIHERSALMLLKSSSPVHLELCAVKRFVPDEYHVTRKYKYSVLILMQEGILRFYENNMLVELYPGDYYIQRADTLQEGLDKYNEPPHREGLVPIYTYMEFSGGEFAEDGNGIPLRGRYPQAKLSETVASCAEAFTAQRHDPFLMTSYLCRTLSELYAAVPDKDPNEDTLAAVRRYIHSAYSSPLTVMQLARQFGYNEDYLTRLFRHRFGTTPGRYLRSVRMEYARWQLLNTDKSIEHIALSVGYRDLSAFYRAFATVYGTSPGACREYGTQA